MKEGKEEDRKKREKGITSVRKENGVVNRKP